MKALKIDEIIEGELPSANTLDEKDEPSPNPLFTSWEEHAISVWSWLSLVNFPYHKMYYGKINIALSRRYLSTTSKDNEFQFK